MTDRINSVLVVFEDNIRIDDAKTLIEAFGWFRGVISVTPNVHDMNAAIALERAKHELGTKLLDVVRGSLTR